MKLNLILTILLFSSAALFAQEPANVQPKQTDKTAKADVKKEVCDSQITARQALDGLIAWDAKLKTLQADFIQQTDFEGTPISSSQGTIYKQNNNIRLDTFEEGTLAQSAVTDKKIIKIKDDKGSLITSLPWDQWREGQTNKALFDFGNYGKVVKEHKLKSFDCDGQFYKLVLVPLKEGPESYELSFKLLAKDFFIEEISLENQGVRTKTTLKNVKKNIKFKESIFK